LVLGLISVAAMAGSVFGPWMTLFGHSVSGLENGNHGSFVVAFAALGEIAFIAYLRKPGWWKAAVAVVAGGAGTAVTLYDRHRAEHAFSSRFTVVQALQSFARIGWGLNLAMIASISMGLAALILILRDQIVRQRARSHSET
jgi:cobalamin synthase